MFDLFDVIIGFVEDLARYLVSILQYIYNLLVAVGNFIWKALVLVANFFWNIATKISGWFHHIWEGFFKNIFAKVFTLVRKVQFWLEEKLAPIIKFLKTARKYWDMVFNKYFKPFIAMMQHVRQVLGVLRQLGFKWAAALDKRIAQIEGQITQIFSQVRSILNGMLDLLNQVCDPLRLLRRPMLVLSFRRTVHSLIRLTTGLPPGYFFPSPRSGVAAGLGALQKGFNKADPGQNPPASAYLKGDDGLGGFSGYSAGVEPQDSDVDSAAMLDFFNDDLYPDPKFDDPADALQAAIDGALSMRVFV